MSVNITIKEIRDEDFTSYKKTSMVIGFPSCTWKCERECGMRVCQNSALAHAPDKVIGVKTIVNRYINNPITSAIIIAGLEPFDSEYDLLKLITYFRVSTDDDIIIYTGYTEEEVESIAIYKDLLNYKNIIIKFGRYIPGQQPHYDEVLGVNLASDNQYAKIITTQN
jgi:hypothetical protein